MTQGDLSTANPTPQKTKNAPFYPTTVDGWNLVKSFRSLRLPEDENGNVWCVPVIITDPNLSRPHIPNEVYNTTSGLFEPQRTPTVFKNGAGAAAATTIWTPAGSKIVRILGGLITVSKEAACAAACSITLYDAGGATVFWRADLSAAALVATGNVIVIPIILPANGYICPATGVIQLALSNALTAGTVSCSLWGTEE